MKLISCYIENFGGLSRYALDFEEGLTVVQAPNGFGKTTLAEFIRAMFYGFPKKTPKQLGKRQKYTPWNGGTCGGHLTFEYEGERYRIERSFGEKPQQDTFKLVDMQTGKLSRRFTKEIGRELFGLDAESFERSTYLPQNRDTGSLTTDSIRAKLGNLVEDTADVGNYEKAVAALKDKRSDFIPYRGNGGAVAEITARITRLQRELDAAGESSRALPQALQHQRELEQFQADTAARIRTVRAELTAARNAEGILAHHQYRERLAAELSEANARLAALKAKYPAGLPSQAEMDKISDTVEQAARLAAQPAATEEDRRARRFVEAHQDRFAGGIPQDEEFDEMYRRRDIRRELELQINACVLPESDTAELEELERIFAPGIPDEDILARHEELQAEADGLRAQNRHLAAQTATAPRYKVPSPLTVPLLLAGGALGLMAGIFLLMRDMTVPGGVMLGLAVLALIAAAWLRQRTGATRQIRTFDPQIQPIIRENERKIAELENALQRFTHTYGGQTPARIRQMISRLAALRRQEAELTRRRGELTRAWDAEDGALRTFFDRFGCEKGDAHEVLNRLRRQCEIWERSRQQLADLERRQQQHCREQAQVRQELERFSGKYGILPQNRDQVLAIRDDIRTVREQTAAARSLEEKLAAHCRANGEALSQPVPEIRADPAVLEQQEQALQDRQKAAAGDLVRLDQHLHRLREEADRVPELEDELASCQARKDDIRQQAELLDATVEFLQQAKDKLATAYMAPVQQSFAGLMARMTGENASKIIVTSELEVRLERAGAGRELAYFSAGQTDLVMLCMRIALVDALFRAAKPALILDDPFVNLDDERTKEALALMQELSRDRQIIYLVCNSSRVSESFVKSASGDNWN